MKLKLLLSFVFAACVMAASVLLHSSHAEAAPRRIEVVAKRFEFAPGDITLKKGEPVVLVLKTADVPHGVKFKELGIETKTSKGQEGQIAFTPDKTGDFVGQCAVFCGSGHGRMRLTIHVVE